MIAETLLLEAFHALDQMPHSPRVRKLLLRVEGGVYARLTAIRRFLKALISKRLDRLKGCVQNSAQQEDMAIA